MIRTERSLEALRAFGSAVLESQEAASATGAENTPVLTADFYSALCYLFPETEPFGIRSVVAQQDGASTQDAHACDASTPAPTAGSLCAFLERCPDQCHVLHATADNQAVNKRCETSPHGGSADRLSVLAKLIAAPADAVTCFNLPSCLASALAVSIMDSTDPAVEARPASLLTRESLLSTFLLYYLRDEDEYAALAERVYAVADTAAQARLFAVSNTIPEPFVGPYQALLQCHAPLCSPFPRLPLCAVLVNMFVRFHVNTDARAEINIHYALLALTSALLYRPDTKRYNIRADDTTPLAIFYRCLSCPHEITLSEWDRWSNLIRGVYPVKILPQHLNDTNLAIHHLAMICRALQGLPTSDYSATQRLMNEAAYALESAIRLIEPAATVGIEHDAAAHGSAPWVSDTAPGAYITVAAPHFQTSPNVKHYVGLDVHSNGVIISVGGSSNETYQANVISTESQRAVANNGFWERMLDALRRTNVEDGARTPLAHSMLDFLFAYPIFSLFWSNYTLKHLLTNDSPLPQPFIRAIVGYVFEHHLYVSEGNMTSLLRSPAILTDVIKDGRKPHGALALWISALYDAMENMCTHACIRDAYDKATRSWTDARGTACRELMGLSRAGVQPPSASASDTLIRKKKHVSRKGRAGHSQDAGAQTRAQPDTFETEVCMHRASLIAECVQQLSSTGYIYLAVHLIGRLDVPLFLAAATQPGRFLRRKFPLFRTEGLESLLSSDAVSLTETQRTAIHFLALAWSSMPSKKALDALQPEQLRLVRPFLLLRLLFNARNRDYLSKQELRAFFGIVRRLVTLEKRALRTKPKDSSAAAQGSEGQAVLVTDASPQHSAAQETTRDVNAVSGAASSSAKNTDPAAVTGSQDKSKKSERHRRKLRINIHKNRELFDNCLNKLLYFLINTSDSFSPARMNKLSNELALLYPERESLTQQQLAAAERGEIPYDFSVGAHQALEWLFQNTN